MTLSDSAKYLATGSFLLSLSLYAPSFYQFAVRVPFHAQKLANFLSELSKLMALTSNLLHQLLMTQATFLFILGFL